MLPSRDDLRRLHFINALFAHVTGHDLYLAEQIKSAITFSLTGKNLLDKNYIEQELPLGNGGMTWGAEVLIPKLQPRMNSWSVV